MADKLMFETGLDATGYETGLKDMEAASAQAGERMGKALTGTTAGYSRGVGSNIGHGGRGGVVGESLVLLRELGRGNYARVPGSATILFQRLGLLKYMLKETDVAGKYMLTTFGMISVGLLAVAAVAYYSYQHFKKLNEQFDRTAEAAAKGYDRSKGMESALKKSADATADLIEWNHKLSASQEGIAQSTNDAIAALTEEYDLKKKLAQEQGANQAALDAMSQEERKLKLEALNKGIAEAQAQLEKDKAAAAAASESAFTGSGALSRVSQIENASSDRSQAEEALKEDRKLQKELQDKVDKQVEKDMAANEINYKNKIYGDDSERVYRLQLQRAQAAAAEKNFAVGPKGAESQENLAAITARIAANEKIVAELKTNIPKLELVQRELADAVKDAEAAGTKDSSAVQSLTRERDKLMSEMDLHGKYDPLIEAAKKPGGIGSGSSDSLTRVGNFLGSSRGQIETLAAEGNRIAREHVSVSRQIEKNTRPQKAPGENHYPIH